MSLKLPYPSDDYSQLREAERNQILERADAQNHKKGRDIEVGNGSKVVLTSSGGARWKITVTDTGSVITEPVKAQPIAFDAQAFNLAFG